MTDSITIDHVTGTGWALAYRPAAPRHAALTIALPAYASPALESAWTERLHTALDGYCHRCEAVAATPAQVKTNNLHHVVPMRLAHSDGCPLCDARLDALERACSPDGSIAGPDLADAAIDLVTAHMRRIAGASGDVPQGEGV